MNVSRCSAPSVQMMRISSMKLHQMNSLRWLVTVSSTFEDYNHYITIGHYNHSIPVDAKIMVSTNFPIIGEQVAVNFVAQ